MHTQLIIRMALTLINNVGILFIIDHVCATCIHDCASFNRMLRALVVMLLPFLFILIY